MRIIIITQGFYGVFGRLTAHKEKTDLKFRTGKFWEKEKCEFLYSRRKNKDWTKAIVIVFGKRGDLTGDNSLDGQAIGSVRQRLSGGLKSRKMRHNIMYVRTQESRST